MYSRRPAVEEARIVPLFLSVPGRLRPCGLFRQDGAIARHACQICQNFRRNESTENVDRAYGKLYFQDDVGQRYGDNSMIPLCIWQDKTVETQVHN